MKKAKLFSCLSVIALMSGCGMFSPPLPQYSPQEQLSDGAFAVYLSGRYDSPLPQNPGSGILFYHPEKQEWSRLDLKGLNGGALSFDGQELHYKDKLNDYSLSADGVKTIEHPEQEMLTISKQIPLPGEGVGSIALVNSGNPTKIITVKGQERTVQEVPDSLSMMATCPDGTVWAMGQSWETSADPVESAYPPDRLYRLYPEFSATSVAEYKSDQPAQTTQHFVCSDNVIYYIIDSITPPAEGLAYAGPEHYTGSKLVSYDTHTGEYREQEIGGDLATRLNDQMWSPTLSPLYLYDGHLWWVSGYGKVVKTDLANAQNTVAFDLGDFEPSKDIGYLVQEDKYLFRFIFDLSGETTIYRYNLETEKLESRATVPGLGDATPRDQYPFTVEILDLEALLKL